MSDDQARINSLQGKMNKSIESLKANLDKLRGGRASVNLLDTILVDYYGTPTPLKQMATLSVPEPRQITCTPWDKSAIPMIEKSIQQADLGVTPVNDGNVIRVNLPALTEERRLELVKVAKKMAEDAKVALRHLRRDENDSVKKELKEKVLTEDDEKRILKKVQDLTDKYVNDIDGMLSKKEEDILAV